MFDPSAVKILGRYAFDRSGILWLASSCCEVSFRLDGATFLAFELLSGAGDSPEDPSAVASRPRYALYIDGKQAADERLEAPAAERMAFENGNPGPRCVRLVKLSECTSGLLGLRAIRTDGVIRPMPDRDLRIEFIGDSITAGYGVEGDITQAFTTATENAEKAYGYLTARALDADAVLPAFSGHGLLSGYTEGSINTEGLVQPVYDKAGKNAHPLPDGLYLQDISWDFSTWQPHYIVLNLGTNDSSWVRDIPGRKENFREKYEEFLAVVREHNPSARILCVLGLMGRMLCPAMEQAVAGYSRRTGDREIRSLTVAEQNQLRDGVGTNYHPSPRSQQLLADQVTEALRAWMAE